VKKTQLTKEIDSLAKIKTAAEQRDASANELNRLMDVWFERRESEPI